LIATNVEMDILGLGAFQSETQYLTFEFQKKRSGNKEATALPPRCGARMRVLAAIDSPDIIRSILSCMDLPTRPPPVAPAMPDGDTSDLW
jgi:hypothetical protein